MNIPKLKKIKTTKNYHGIPLEDDYSWVDQPNILKVLKDPKKLNTEVKDLRDGIGKYVEFTVVETDKKGGKYRIINCFPSEEPQDSIIKTVKTNYKLSN